jgi:hypothetical protein
MMMMMVMSPDLTGLLQRNKFHCLHKANNAHRQPRHNNNKEETKQIATPTEPAIHEMSLHRNF